MQVDKRGNIYVSSRGDYYNVPPDLFVINSATDQVVSDLNLPVSEMCMVGDSLYFYSVAYSHHTGQNTVTYGILDTRTQQVVSDKIIPTVRIRKY